jgi:hypothetical protein
VGLSWAQAVEVSKRLDPRPGQVVVFASDGSVLHAWEAQHGRAARCGAVYACRREPGGVSVARVAVEDLEARREPMFGAPW